MLSSLNTINLTELIELWIDGTTIFKVDTSQLSKLEKLYANDTKLSYLNAYTLTNLKELYIGNTGISEIETGRLGKLEVLYAY